MRFALICLVALVYTTDAQTAPQPMNLEGQVDSYILAIGKKGYPATHKQRAVTQLTRLLKMHPNDDAAGKNCKAYSVLTSYFLKKRQGVKALNMYDRMIDLSCKFKYIPPKVLDLLPGSIKVTLTPANNSPTKGLVVGHVSYRGINRIKQGMAKEIQRLLENNGQPISLPLTTYMPCGTYPQLAGQLNVHLKCEEKRTVTVGKRRIQENMPTKVTVILQGIPGVKEAPKPHSWTPAWHSYTLWGLAAAGGVIGGIKIAEFYRIADEASSDLQIPAWKYQEKKDTAQQALQQGNIALISGGVLLAAGVATWLIWPDSSADEQTHIGFVPINLGGGMVTLQIPFP